jgi:hypothetical protein
MKQAKEDPVIYINRPNITTGHSPHIQDTTARKNYIQTHITDINNIGLQVPWHIYVHTIDKQVRNTKRAATTQPFNL